METFAEWIESELRKRGWRPADLAQAASIPGATLSRILSGSRGAGPDVCTAIANALDYPQEVVFRKAGLLQDLPPETELSRRAMRAFTRLDRDRQISAIAMLEGLAGQPVRSSDFSRSSPPGEPLATWRDHQGDLVELLSAAFVTEEARAAYAARERPAPYDAGQRPPDIPSWRWVLAGLLTRLLDGLPPDDVDAVFDLMKRTRDRLGTTGAPNEENPAP